MHVSATLDFTGGADHFFPGTGGVIQFTNAAPAGSGFFKLEVSE